MQPTRDYYVAQRMRAARTAEEVVDDTRDSFTGAAKVDPELTRAHRDAERAATTATAEHAGILAAIARTDADVIQTATAVRDAEAAHRLALIDNATRPTTETATALAHTTGRLEEAQRKLSTAKSAAEALRAAEVECAAKVQTTATALEKANRKRTRAVLTIADEKARAVICDVFEVLRAKLSPALAEWRVALAEVEAAGFDDYRQLVELRKTDPASLLADLVARFGR